MIFTLLLSTFTQAAPIEYQWDKIEFEREQNQVKCQVYPKFVLFQSTEDAAGYKVQARRKRVPTQEECVEDPKANEVTSGVFKGAIGTTLVMVDAGPLGDESNLVLLDANSGKPTLTVLHDVRRPVKFEKVGGRVQLTLDKFLDEPAERCNLTCFDKVIRANKVPGAAKIKPPKCDAKDPALFMQARVRDIRHPSAKFVGRKVTCAER